MLAANELRVNPDRSAPPPKATNAQKNFEEKETHVKLRAVYNKFESFDYQPIKSQLKRKAIVFLLTLFTKGVSFQVVFDENTVENIGHEKPAFSLAPPNLRSALAICLYPSYMFAQQYCLGKWYCKEDLSEFIIHLVKQLKNRNNRFRYSIFDKILHIWRNYFDKEASRKAAEHYDVDADFYKMILGDERVYSCAFFDDNHSSLEQAQSNKLETTFKRLSLNKSDPDLRILDIGCGWGGMVRHIAENTDAKIDAITISQEQLDFNLSKVSTINNCENISFYKSDIVDFSPDDHGQYDRIVSIAMLEHVGKNRIDEYFACVDKLLKSGGKAVIHFITKENNGYNNAWIDKHIFRGGYIPKVSEVTDSINRVGLRLSETHMHAGINYKKTLQVWKDNLIENQTECMQVLKSSIVRDGAEQHTDIDYRVRCEFRKWHFYLCAVQAMFDEDAFGDNVCQLVIEKGATK